MLRITSAVIGVFLLGFIGLGCEDKPELDSSDSDEKNQKSQRSDIAVKPGGLTKSSIILNADCGAFFQSRPESEMTLEGCRAFVDQFAASNISHLFLNCVSQKTAYPSKVWESYREIDWDVVAQLSNPGLVETEKRIIARQKLLASKGLDRYAIWIDRCREQGISPWLSMRMNDLHTVHEHENPLNNSFWRNNPQFWRVPDSLDDKGFVPVRCFERAFD